MSNDDPIDQTAEPGPWPELAEEQLDPLGTPALAEVSR
jgi:hypothetical protein